MNELATPPSPLATYNQRSKTCTGVRASHPYIGCWVVWGVFEYIGCDTRSIRSHTRVHIANKHTHTHESTEYHNLYANVPLLIPSLTLSLCLLLFSVNYTVYRHKLRNSDKQCHSSAASIYLFRAFCEWSWKYANGTRNYVDNCGAENHVDSPSCSVRRWM